MNITASDWRSSCFLVKMANFPTYKNTFFKSLNEKERAQKTWFSSIYPNWEYFFPLLSVGILDVMSDFQSPGFNVLVLEVLMKYPLAPSLDSMVFWLCQNHAVWHSY